jgi:hypothetical protein
MRRLSNIWLFALFGPPFGYAIWLLGEPAIRPFPSFLPPTPIVTQVEMLPWSYVMGGIPAALTGALFARWSQTITPQWRRLPFACIIGAAVSLTFCAPLVLISTPHGQHFPTPGVLLFTACGAFSASFCALIRHFAPSHSGRSA